VLQRRDPLRVRRRGVDAGGQHDPDDVVVGLRSVARMIASSSDHPGSFTWFTSIPVLTSRRTWSTCPLSLAGITDTPSHL